MKSKLPSYFAALTAVSGLTAILLSQSAQAQLAIADIGPTAPTPNSGNDIANLASGYQRDDGFLYRWVNGLGAPVGQTFSTGGNPGGYTLTNLAVKTYGGGSGGNLLAQTFTVRIYSIDTNTDPVIATLVQTVPASGQLTREGNWLNVTGLGVSLLADTNYAYTIVGNSGYEWLGNNKTDPYAGGEICAIPIAGGTVQFGATRVSDAVFVLGLTPGTVSGGTPAVADIGNTTPTPGPNDIAQLVGDLQATYGMNYYWLDSGQTFTTPNSSSAWLMNRLALKFGGCGGSGHLNPKNFVLRLYSVANGTNATLIYSNSAAGQLLSEDGNWFDCTGLALPLQPNQQYAYTFSVPGGGGDGSWELVAARDGNPYSGGQICQIPGTGGTITYAPQGANADAGFLIGLDSPCIYAVPPTITPVLANYYAGTTVTLVGSVIGSGTPFTYQWQADDGIGNYTNIPAPAGTSLNLTVDTTSLLGTYNYQLIGSSISCGSSSTSSIVTLNITSASAPFFTMDTTATPNLVTNTEGGSQTYSVAVEGSGPPAIQWYKATDASGTGAVPLAGKTNATLTLSSLQLSAAGFYAAVATNNVSPFTATSTYLELAIQSTNSLLIQWQAPVAFDGLSAVRILTNPITAGSGIVAAAHFGNSTNVPVVINGVTNIFYGDGSKAFTAGYAGKTTGAYITGSGKTTTNANFDWVLNNFNFDGAGPHNITLRNLVVGSNYYVQIFALDNRGAGAGRSANFQDSNDASDISQTIGMSENKYIVGTFKAKTNVLVIQQNMLPNFNQGNINALVIGTIGWTPGWPANFTAQPASVLVGVGGTAQYTIATDAQPAATTRWQISTDGGTIFNDLTDGSFSGATISGALTNTLTIANAPLAANGWIVRNAASNTFGITYSATANLSVAVPTGNSRYWIIPGAGNWDTTSGNWSDTVDVSSGATTWVNGDSAIFSADGGSIAQYNVTINNAGVGINNLTQRFGRVRLLSGPIGLLNPTTVINTQLRVSGDYDLRIDSQMSGTAAIVKNGPGILLLLGNKNFSGGIVLNEGTLAFESTTAGAGTGPITLNGGNFVRNFNAVTLTNSLDVRSNVNVIVYQNNPNWTLTGPWLAGTASGNFNVVNTNVNGIAPQSTTILVTGDIAAYTGTLTHSNLASGGNRLRFGDNAAGVITVNGANAKFVTLGSTTGGNAIDIGDAKTTAVFKMGELSGSGGAVRGSWSTTGNTTFEIGALNTSSTYSGVVRDNINGAGGRVNLAKVGSGTLTFGVAQVYTGFTAISNGTLRVNAPYLADTTNVIIAASGKLDLNFVGSDTVKSLFIAGVPMAAGTYGATGSGAVNIDDVHFAGPGVLIVTAPPVPANLTSSVSGNVLSLSWPANQSWTLQAQTNALSVGLSSTWTTLVPSSAGVSSTNITINPANPTVFYRLVYP